MKKWPTLVLTEDQIPSLGEEYHVASRNQGGTKHLVNEHLVHYSDRVQELAQSGPLCFSECPKVALPEVRVRAAMSLEKAILRRVSSREFSSCPLPAEALATLLYLGNGVRKAGPRTEEGYVQRNAPNSGNLGSVEIFVIATNVAGVQAGIYHFDSLSNQLSQLRTGDFSAWLCENVFFQLEFSKASAALVLSSRIGRLKAKYGLRAYRMALLDVGHVSENIYLAATALNLQVCATAGFIDDEIDAALSLDGLDVASMLVLLVGPSQ